MERLIDAMTALSAVATPGDLPGHLADIAAQYGLSTVAYLGSGLPGWTGTEPYLAVTYSTDWVEYYRQRNFVAIDPVIRTGLRQLLPIDWGVLSTDDQPVRRFFNEAQDFGVGREGLTIPIHGRNGERALFSITAHTKEHDWRKQRLYLMRDFQLLAAFTHDAVVRLEGLSKPTPRLSPRERECLLWAAEGKTAWETSHILSISESTVRHYLETARGKLAAVSNAHAVAKAMRTGLLSSLL
ncbi:helix-turn-helix transcriptional regulator [Devosia sp. LjRoot3]|uniref:helix-turn-helix transcriptional regulator n=1 Tax=Devosia sp. LjRoot3 TaxID=3342319 RepID=UPI003ECFED91